VKSNKRLKRAGSDAEAALIMQEGLSTFLRHQSGFLSFGLG
jgi:hypothetical protein